MPATTISRARADVESAFSEALAWAEDGGARRFSEFEQKLWSLMLTLGCALVGLFLVRWAARPRSETYLHQRGRYQLDGTRTSKLATMFGKVAFTRPVGRRRGASSAKADLPVDRELGLCGGFSLGVVVGVARLCAQMAFANARREWRETYGWAPSSRAVLRMVDAVGEQARPFLEGLEAPKNDGEILVAEVDSGGAPMISPKEYRCRTTPHRKGEHSTMRSRRHDKRIERERPRRTKGKKSKNAKMAVVAAVYTLKRMPDGKLEGPLNKRIIATFANHEQLFLWLRRELEKRGYPGKRTVFLADGSKAIWRAQERHLPGVEVGVDWYHIAEKLWTAGEAFFAEGSVELKTWVKEQKRNLRRGWKSAVLRELKWHLRKIPRTGPGNKGRRERVSKVIAHLKFHWKRLRYKSLRRDDLPIGTGVIEGAVRNLVRMRLDGPGMRWGRERAELVLHLRCVLLSGEWPAFRAALADHRPPVLGSQPTPATPFEAETKAA